MFVFVREREREGERERQRERETERERQRETERETERERQRERQREKVCGARVRAEEITSSHFFFYRRYNPLWVCILQPSSGLKPPRVRGFLITHNDTPQSVGLPWTSDQSVAKTST